MIRRNFPPILSDNEFKNLSSHNKSIYVREVISNTLRVNENGLTGTLLKEMLPFDKRVIQKYLDIMEFTNQIYSHSVGSAKLYIHNGKAMHELVSQTLKVVDQEYKILRLSNRLGDSILIQQKSVYDDQITGCIQIPQNEYDNFLKYLQKSRKDMESRFR